MMYAVITIPIHRKQWMVRGECVIFLLEKWVVV